LKYGAIVRAVRDVIDQYVERLTIRQIYYRLISPPYQLFANTASNYKRLVKMLTRAREEGDINWRRIEDRARNTYGGDYGYGSVEEYVKSRIESFKDCYYSRRMWDDQPRYVEVWLEKDALTSLFTSVADKYRVLVYPSRGYSSFTRVMEAIEDRFNLKDGKKVVVLHFSDHDPSGLDMTRDIRMRLMRYGASNVTVKRIALTIEQVKALNLAPNPTKKTDPRARWYVDSYGDRCWELDAVEPNTLRDIVAKAIEAYIDKDVWNKTVERSKREYEEAKERLEKLAKRLEDGYE